MRSYCIDEMRPEEISLFRQRLQEMELSSGLEGIFWLPLPTHLLTEEQRSHSAVCGPHCMALDCSETGVQLELLVRALGKIRCSCVVFATPEQRAHMISYVDELLAELGIRA